VVPQPALVSEPNASGVSETSFSSDSISYYLKLRPQDASQPQQQALPDKANDAPRRRLLQHQDSVKLSQDRLVKQMQLRQVSLLFFRNPVLLPQIHITDAVYLFTRCDAFVYPTRCIYLPDTVYTHLPLRAGHRR
jgi:hypothetical protein